MKTMTVKGALNWYQTLIVPLDSSLRFQPGTTWTTPGTRTLFNHQDQDAALFVLRHLRGDWGSVSIAQRHKNNRSSLEQPDGMGPLSQHSIHGRFFLIRTLFSETGPAQTYVYLPEED